MVRMCIVHLARTGPAAWAARLPAPIPHRPPVGSKTRVSPRPGAVSPHNTVL